jgi:hypothetical protein
VADLRLELLALCDFALTSKEGKLSLIGIFDRIFAQKIPSTFARFFVVAVLTGKPESQHKISLSIKNPQGNEMLPKVKEINIKLGNEGRSNIISNIVNMPLPMPGEYRATLRKEKNKLGEKKFGVINVGVKQARKRNLPN